MAPWNGINISLLVRRPTVSCLFTFEQGCQLKRHFVLKLITNLSRLFVLPLIAKKAYLFMNLPILESPLYYNLILNKVSIILGKYSKREDLLLSFPS